MSGDGVNIGGGGIFDGSGNQYTGLIDEVVIFNQALTREQILALIPSPEEVEVQPVPTTSRMGLAALLLLVFGAAFMALRRHGWQ